MKTTTKTTATMLKSSYRILSLPTATISTTATTAATAAASTSSSPASPTTATLKCSQRSQN